MTPPIKELVKSLMLSNLVYMNQIEEIAKVIGYPKVKFISGSLNGQDSQGYVLLEERTAYVIFRGTENAKDFINDMEALILDSVSFDRAIKLHRGFHLQYKAIEEQLTTFLDENHTLYDEIVFTGHSLGGSLATVALVYYFYKNQDPLNFAATNIKKVIKAQTFGSPRVGDSTFGAYYGACLSAENHWRVFNEDDPAAKFPSQTEWISKDVYQHVPGNALCLLDGTPQRYEVTQVDNKLSVPWHFVRDLAHHHTAVYMERLLLLANPALNASPIPPAITTEVIEHDLSAVTLSTAADTAGENVGSDTAVAPSASLSATTSSADLSAENWAAEEPRQDNAAEIATEKSGCEKSESEKQTDGNTDSENVAVAAEPSTCIIC